MFTDDFTDNFRISYIDINRPPLVPKRRPRIGPVGLKPVTELLRLLDSRVCPGIAVSDFRRLFTQCEKCELITTRRAFNDHICVEVIDLTSD